MQRNINAPTFHSVFEKCVNPHCEYDEDEEDEELYYGGRVSAFNESYMKMKEINPSELENAEKEYIRLLLHNMIDLLEEIDAGTYEVLKREMTYIVFKTMNTKIALDYFRTHHLFSQYCVDLAEETLEYIEEDFDEDDLWKSTRNAVDDFLAEMK